VIAEAWARIGKAGRIGIVAGAALLVIATSVTAWWLLRRDWQVLFAELTPQDTAAMTAELDRQRVPYTVREDGPDGSATILVDGADVHATRLKLMARDIPVRGAVGFELFNESDFGMTEFAQRINYQRALQGELTRTILSLAEVRDARVLLALPEQGLFKQARAKPTASVTLTLRRGRTLAAAQVAGIQRLVSAAVPGIAAADVTIVDQTGVALTRSAADGDGPGGSAPLDLKRETELYLSRKVESVLERAVGPGQAIAIVDVTLDMNRVQTTTEEVVPAPGSAQTGIVVRERETVREVGTPLATTASVEGGAPPLGGSAQREVDYAVGRRVEQVAGQPGTIKRLNVAAVVKRTLDPRQEAQLRAVVAAAAGAVAERGDTVVIHAMDGALLDPGDLRRGAAAIESGTGAGPADAELPPMKRGTKGSSSLPVLATGLVLAALAAWFVLRRRAAAAAPPAPLPDATRKAALAQVQAWMRGDARRPAGEGR
jgi:flagellar M-ring protein FliF